MTKYFITFAVLAQFCAFFIWFAFIRPFLKENGVHTLRGATVLATVMNDIEQAIRISKEIEKWPMSLSFLIAVETISIALFISAAYF